MECLYVTEGSVFSVVKDPGFDSFWPNAYGIETARMKRVISCLIFMLLGFRYSELFAFFSQVYWDLLVWPYFCYTQYWYCHEWEIIWDEWLFPGWMVYYRLMEIY